MLLIVFSIDDSDSFKRAQEMYKDALGLITSASFILVGAKADLEASRQVTKEQAAEFAKGFHLSMFFIDTS